MTAMLDEAQLKALYDEAMGHQAAGRHEQALALYGRLLAARPQSPEVHFQIGRIFLAEARPARALPHAEAATAQRPTEPAVWVLRGQAVALLADDDAEKRFRAALAASTLDAGARIRLQNIFDAHYRYQPSLPRELAKEMGQLMVLMNARRFPEAELLAQGLLGRFPKVAALANILATAQARQGKREAAIANYQRATQIDPADPEPLNNLGHLLSDQRQDAQAAAALRAAVVLAPNHVMALSQLALLMNRQGQPHEALPLAQKARRLAPKEALPLIALGNIHTRLKDFRAAEEVLRKALVLAPRRPDVHALLGQALTRLAREDEAMQAFDRALELNPDLPLALSSKATMLQTLGRFDEAEVYFQRAFKVTPLNGDLFRIFGAAHRKSAEDGTLELMIAGFNNPRSSDESRMNFGFAIAKALEDARRYDEAFPWLEKANAIAARLWPFDIARREAEIDELIAIFRDFDFAAAEARLAASGVVRSDFAPIFVTGMPRSGTTLIEQIIASHSQVTGTGELGEASRLALHLLRENDHAPLAAMASLGDAQIAGIGQEYEALVRAMFPGIDRISDKSIQTYLFIGLLKLALPKARFIVVRRDPRDTLLSIFKNKFPDGTHSYSYDQAHLARYYRTFVRMIDMWRAILPEGWFTEVDYEALVDETEPRARALIAASGLDWQEACLNFHKTERKVDTLSVFQVRQPISRSSVGAWQRYAPGLSQMIAGLEGLLPEDPQRPEDPAQAAATAGAPDGA